MQELKNSSRDLIHKAESQLSQHWQEYPEPDYFDFYVVNLVLGLLVGWDVVGFCLCPLWDSFYAISSNILFTLSPVFAEV